VLRTYFDFDFWSAIDAWAQQQMCHEPFRVPEFLNCRSL
jgi:hypothetical protein